MDTQGRARKGRLAQRERELSALANRQHGVISRRQLLDAGLGPRTIRRRVEAGRLHLLYRGVYAFGREGVSERGRWLGGVLVGGEGALLSHRSAASLWGLMADGPPVEITVPSWRRVPGIALHEGGVHPDERTESQGIPVTTVARALLDIAEVVDEREFGSAFEEAERLRLLSVPELESVCARGFGRRGLKWLRPKLDLVRPTTRSPLETRVLELCRTHSLPIPETNVEVLGREVDAYWPAERLMIEADGYAFHGHRAAFERDRARDAEMQVAGYRVIRLTHRRLDEEPEKVAAQIRHLLTDVPAPRGTKKHPGPGTSSGGERGQGAVEWVGLLALVGLMLAGLVAGGVGVPGTGLARAVASRVLCAVALAERCGDEPALIAAYGTEVGKLAREHMPALLFERGSRAVPVDFRRCRRAACGDGAERGYVRRTEAGLPVTAFVHVVDCRPDAVEGTEVAGADCSGERAGNLYIQYWLYYADSATLRGVPIVGARGYHRDDWESVQFRIRPDGSVDERASSHHGYNHDRSAGNWGSDAGLGPLRDLAEAAGLRARGGWGPETHVLLVSGGSHAGNANGYPDLMRIAPPGQVHLVPLEPVAASAAAGFAVTPPWRKRVWRDPEATGTD